MPPTRRGDGYPLLALPPPLLHLIAAFLPLSTKLSSLSHLSSTYPLPAIPSFSHDDLPLSIAAFRAFERWPHTLHLLSHVSSLTATFRQEDDEAFDVNPRHPLAPFPLADVCLPLHHLTTLRLRLVGERNWLNAFLRGLVRASKAFGHVRSMALSFDVACEERVVLEFGGLAEAERFPSLTALRLDKAELDQRGFLLLCAMRQLESLDLRRCSLYVLDHQPAPSAPCGPVELTVSPRWRSLLLPDSSASYEPLLAALLTVYVATVINGRDGMERGGEDEDEGEQKVRLPLLSHLTFNARLTLDTIRLLTSLTSLTSLDLTDCHMSAHLDLSTLCSRDGRPLLAHLRCLLLWRSVLQPRPRDKHGASLQEAYATFLSAYAGQLRVLAMGLPKSMPFAGVLLGHVLLCSQLRVLRLWGQQLPVPAREPVHAVGPPPPLVHLHTLSLQELPLFATEVGVIAELCPALADLELQALPLCAADALPQLARCCSRLQRLRLIGCNGDALRRRKETELNSSALLSSSFAHSSRSSPTSPPFPALAFLQMTPTNLSPLLPLLSSLPSLRYMDHAASTNYLPIEQLHLLAPLAHLDGINLGRMVMDGRVAELFEDRKRRPEAEGEDHGGEERWSEEVKVLVVLRKEFMAQCSAWRAFVRERRADGGDGRAAFFALLEDDKCSTRASAKD